MSEENRPRSALGVGISTVVTVMVVVLLTTFSVLALVSARAELRLANKATESTENYYAADSQAEKWLADLDAFIGRGHDNLEGALATAGYKPEAAGEGKLRIAELFSLDDSRDLIVELVLDGEGKIDILRWQTVPK
jgi:hypothetical protein